jgi:hypothetical protein
MLSVEWPFNAKRQRRFDEGGTQRVRTVLGLSKTSMTIGWVLVDGRDITGDPLDHDVFDISDSSAAAPAATARRVRDIATASGYTVDSVHVTTSGNMSSLRDALTESGFGEVVAVPLTEATRAWAIDAGRANEQATIAVCVLGRDSASLSVVDTDSGVLHATTTTITSDTVGLTDWLGAALGDNGSRPEALYLIGSRSKLRALAGPLGTGLSIPVVATHDAQLALARGATFSDGTRVHHGAVSRRSGLAAHARTLSVVAAVAVVSLFTLSSAGSPIPLAKTSLPRSAPAAAGTEKVPTSAPPVAPAQLPPPAADQSVPEEPTPTPTFEATPVIADVVAPDAVPAVAPATVDVAPQIEHVPEVQPVQHIPAQPAVAPDPAAPAPPDTPPPDPLAAVLSPLFSGLP